MVAFIQVPHLISMGSGGKGISFFVIFKNVFIRKGDFRNTFFTEDTTLSTSENSSRTFLGIITNYTQKISCHF